jgi:hypothetical protein
LFQNGIVLCDSRKIQLREKLGSARRKFDTLVEPSRFYATRFFLLVLFRCATTQGVSGFESAKWIKIAGADGGCFGFSPREPCCAFF